MPTTDDENDRGDEDGDGDEGGRDDGVTGKEGDSGARDGGGGSGMGVEYWLKYPVAPVGYSSLFNKDFDSTPEEVWD